MIIGAIVNTMLDPIFIFAFHWGIFGAALATILGQFLSFLFAVRYLWRFKTVQFEKKSFQLNLRESLSTCSMGISSSANQIAITFVQIILYNSLNNRICFHHNSAGSQGNIGSINRLRSIIGQ